MHKTLTYHDCRGFFGTLLNLVPKDKDEVLFLSVPGAWHKALPGIGAAHQILVHLLPDVVSLELILDCGHMNFALRFRLVISTPNSTSLHRPSGIISVVEKTVYYLKQNGALRLILRKWMYPIHQSLFRYVLSAFNMPGASLGIIPVPRELRKVWKEENVGIDDA